MSLSFDRAAAFYDETRGYRPEVAAAIGSAIAMAAEATPATHFLEIGAGTGRIGMPLAMLDYQYTGIDISPAMLDRFREKLDVLAQRRGQQPRVRLMEADALALPFPDRSFDVVIATHVFHLVSDPERAWQEARRALRSGGMLLACSDAALPSESETISERWRAIVGEEYGPIAGSGDASTQLVRAERARTPALQVEELRPVQWEQTTTLAEEIDGIRRRCWSNTWRLPDDVFERCLSRLTAWATATYGDSLSALRVRRSEFVIRRVRFDS